MNSMDERLRIANVGRSRELSTTVGYDGTYPGDSQHVTTADGVTLTHPMRPREYNAPDDETTAPLRNLPTAVRNGARIVNVGTSGQVVEGEATLRGWCLYNDTGVTVTVELHDRSKLGNVIAKSYIPTGTRDLVFLGESGIVIHNLFLIMTDGNATGSVWIGGQNE